MGRLTTEVTRLVGEIQHARGERQRLLQSITQATAEMRRAVARMQGGFRAAHAEMARRQQRSLREFVLGLDGRVAALRSELRTDLAGARTAWLGMATGAAGRDHPKRARTVTA